LASGPVADRALPDDASKIGQEGSVIDPNLLFAHALVYTAAITLHEHHINLMAFGDPSSAYVLAAARGAFSLAIE
jgi:hypothetical protein